MDVSVSQSYALAGHGAAIKIGDKGDVEGQVGRVINMKDKLKGVALGLLDG